MTPAPTHDARRALSPRPAPAAEPALVPGALEAQAAALQARARVLSYLRVLAFAGLVTVVLLAPPPSVPGSLGATGALACFLVLVLAHGRCLDRRAGVEVRLLLVREQAARLRSRRRERSAPAMPAAPLALEEGRRGYADEPPGFTLEGLLVDDLELLAGPRNLFGLLDTSSTVFGAWRLRYMITHPLTCREAIRERHDAVAAVVARPGLRWACREALAPLRRWSYRSLPRALREPAPFADRHGLRRLADLLGTLAPLGLVAALWWPQLLAVTVVLVVVNAFLIARHVRTANPARDRLIALRPLAEAVLRLDALLSSADAPDDPSWEAIQRTLAHVRPALRALVAGARRLSLHGMGVLFELFNVLVLWELRHLPRLETLLVRCRDDLERALGAVGETEALLSLATLPAEQTGFVVPEPLAEPRPRLEAKALGHPLIDPEVLVRNDVSVGDEQRVWVITGSNMAGKSTLLKSVGANVVLAGIGAAVCADAFRWTPLRLYTDINVRDSLDDGKSYFQVEVEHVRRVLEEVREAPMTLALFDELFRGTNSEERLAISHAIIDYIREHGALLLAATHDATLTRLAAQGGGMANFHFRERVEGSTMVFDYRLRPGPAPTRNAVRVLEVHGYPAEVTRAARRELGD